MGRGAIAAAACSAARRVGRPLALGFASLLALLTFVVVGRLRLPRLRLRRSSATSASPSARADGIVALTGGAQRIGDAIDLLAKGYAAPPPDHRRQRAHEPRRDRPPQSGPAPALRLLRRPRLPRPQHRSATPSRPGAGWSGNGFRSLIVVTSNYHMPRTLRRARPRAARRRARCPSRSCTSGIAGRRLVAEPGDGAAARCPNT